MYPSPEAARIRPESPAILGLGGKVGWLSSDSGGCLQPIFYVDLSVGIAIDAPNVHEALIRGPDNIFFGFVLPSDYRLHQCPAFRLGRLKV